MNFDPFHELERVDFAEHLFRLKGVCKAKGASSEIIERIKRVSSEINRILWDITPAGKKQIAKDGPERRHAYTVLADLFRSIQLAELLTEKELTPEGLKHTEANLFPPVLVGRRGNVTLVALPGGKREKKE